MQTIEALKQAVAQAPNNPEHLYNLGGAYLAAQQFQAALSAYQQALQLAPQHPQILLQLGNTASAAQQFEAAIDYFQQCVAATPDNVGAYFNLGNAYRDAKQLPAAIRAYQQAIALMPNHAEAHNNLGNVYRELGQLDQAIAAYETALQHQPDCHHARAHLIHQKQHICDWDGLDAQITQLQAVLNTYPEAQIAPFAFLAMPNTSAAEQLQCASQWAKQRFAKLAAQHLPYQHPKREAGSKIKVAYLSSDFRLHPLAYLITEVLAAHSRPQFEVFAYSASQDDSAEHQAIRDAVDHFVDISQMPDKAVADNMHTSGIDILVDLTGYTKNSRTSIVAYKPVPVSINWLGFAGTMGGVGALNGASLFDYIIVDETIAPNEMALSEQRLVLPCYQPNNASRPMGEAGTRASHDLPEDAWVFCSFNQSFKITQPVFSAWMTILNQVENSVLWLLDCNRWAKQNLIAQAVKAGVDKDRIIFAPRVSIADHLARHQHADLFLDTMPYNAHTTASDALYTEVPIVTCLGDTFASRVCASLLKQVGCASLVTTDLSAYIALAVEIAQSPNRQQALKATIRQHKQQLFNPQAFVTQLEAAYRQVLAQ